MRNIIHTTLDADSEPVVGTLCTHESRIIIVTLRFPSVTLFRRVFISVFMLTYLEKEKARAGDQWFNLPRTDLTPELKRDLQLLRMRSVLDPKRHYKKDNANGQAPGFSQVGTLIEGPTEYFSARIPYTERKRTLLEEVLVGEASTGRFKRKYNNVQAARSSGKIAFYKKLKEKRSRSFRNSRSSE